MAGSVSPSVRAGWGEQASQEALARQSGAPEVAEDDGFRDWFAWHMRRSLSPGAALTSFRAAMALDVADILAAGPRSDVGHPTARRLPALSHFAAERIRGTGAGGSSALPR